MSAIADFSPAKGVSVQIGQRHHQAVTGVAARIGSAGAVVGRSRPIQRVDAFSEHGHETTALASLFIEYCTCRMLLLASRYKDECRLSVVQASYILVIFLELTSLIIVVA
uniref:Uncharacterized protein n=2 Tax=Setaria TaxID=4554 RepID=K3XNF5_SETIT|nr:hypothetical protein SEVIR_5G337700v2 [Setaria viridis]